MAFDDIRSEMRRRVILGMIVFIASCLLACLPLSASIGLGISQHDGHAPAGEVFDNTIIVLVVVFAVVALLPLLGSLFVRRLTIAGVPGARELGDQPSEQALRRSVENMAIAAGISMPRIMVVDRAELNAAALGLGDNRTVIFTTAMLERQSEQREALVAMCIARCALIDGGLGLLLSVLSAPGVLISRFPILRAYVFVAAFVIAAATVLTAVGSPDVESLAYRSQGFLVFLVVLIVSYWFTEIWRRGIFYPAEVGIDAAAISLTRYPTAIRSLFAETLTHQRGRYSFRNAPNKTNDMTSSVWVLPVTKSSGGLTRLRVRLAALDRIDPTSAASGLNAHSEAVEPEVPRHLRKDP